jgi:hypothetical protein
MKNDAEFPGIEQEDSDDISWFDTRGDKTSRQALDSLSVLSVSDPSAAGAINDGRLCRIAAAGVEYEVVKE